MDTVRLNDTIATLEDATRTLQKHASALKGLLSGLPCNTEELEALLHELADADEDCAVHFSRFESERGIEWDLQSRDCRDDWSRCHQRREAAIRRLTRFATAMRSGKEAA